MKINVRNLSGSDESNNLRVSFIMTLLIVLFGYRYTEKPRFLKQIVRNGCVNEKIEQGRSYSQENVTIINCFFSRNLEYVGIGGVIDISIPSLSMNISFSMFFNCSCTNHGGAIYFNSENSNLRMICANRCSCASTHNYNFACLFASGVNNVDYLSLSHCSHTTSGYYSVSLQSGSQRVDNSNISLNSVIHSSGIRFESSSLTSSSHCTFSNNIVSSFICISYFSSSGTMSYANIIDNNSPSNYGVVFVNGATPKIQYCIFDSNQNNLFYLFSGSLEVSHSFISHSSSSISAGLIISADNNNSITKRQSYQKQFFDSYYCHADFPILVQTPKKTVGQTIHETDIETPYRSFAECKFSHQVIKRKDISVIFTFSFMFRMIIFIVT